MTTLPTMSDEQIRAIFKQCERAGGYLDVQDVARAIIAARDAQWQAAVDAAVMQERAELEALAYDGWTVLKHLTDEAKDRTTHQNVSDVLDAFAKVIRARTKEKT